MQWLSALLRLILIVTFGVAGVAKLRDRAGTRRMLAEFGVAARWAGPLSVVLPLAELAVCGLLMWRATAWLGAAGAVALLALFLGGICYSLAKERRPVCNCFGQTHAQPIGGFTVLRNVLLLGCAALLLVRQSWFVPVVIIVGIVLLQVLARLGAIDRRFGGEATAAAPGLHVGAHAPEFALENLIGERITLSALLECGRPLLLLFMSPHCEQCLELEPEVGAWMRERPSGLEVVVITEGSAEENPEKVRELDSRRTMLQTEQEIAAAYHAWGTPAALVVRRDGSIGSGVAQGAPAIRTLIGEVWLQEAARGGEAVFAPVGRRVDSR